MHLGINDPFFTPDLLNGGIATVIRVEPVHTIAGSGDGICKCDKPFGITIKSR